MQNISFKGYIPVEYYAKHPITNKYVPVIKDKNVKRCQNFVVRNLNGTLLEKSKNQAFINAYKAVDKDYQKTPAVRSFYDKFAPTPQNAFCEIPYYSYLFTGSDVDKIDKIGKDLGKEKSDIFEATGEKDNPAIRQAKLRYSENIRTLLNRVCSRVQDDKGNNLVLRVFFKPKYDTKGNLKKFEYQDMFFYPEAKINF